VYSPDGGWKARPTNPPPPHVFLNLNFLRAIFRKTSRPF